MVDAVKFNAAKNISPAALPVLFLKKSAGGTPLA
jgi:hypothetical protein